MGCEVNFIASTPDDFTTGFAIADPLPNPFDPKPLVVKLLATDCDNGVMPRVSDDSALTDPFVFRCPEKIIASYPVGNEMVVQVAANVQTS